MSVQFRQRTPGEYLKILKRRKWLIILPVIAVASAVAWVVYRLPDVYESSTLVVVKPSTLPNSVVPTVTEDSLTRQLSSIAQVVTSRSSLEPLVVKYELYKRERERGEPMESVIDMMRRDIAVQVNTSRNDITDGFDIKFRYRDPRITQAVTAELASKYVSVQTANTVNSTVAAKQFIDNQVKQTKDELDAIDAKRLQFMKDNLGSLPSEAQSLLSQLTGLREQQKVLLTEMGRLQDRRSTVASQLTLVKKQTEQAIGDAAENMTDPKTTQAWAQLVSRKADLQAELQHLLTELKPKHPDVLAKQAQIESVQKDMDQQIADWKERIAEKQKKLQNRPDMQASAMELEIKNIEAEIKREQGLIADNEKQIGSLTERINRVPGSDVALGALDREYQTKKAAFDLLLQQQQKITLGADAATQQQSEGIEVVDPANLPAKPVAPKRLMLAGIGIVAGLALGLLLTAIFEIPLLLTIQSAEDARHYTGLPVLISVPEVLTPQEARALPRRRRLLLVAGMIATIVSIPLLALALRLTHVFEILSQSSGRV
ncbi:MAG TPA: Wzz/FepE/Etk N-terminal domain-containing protein [Pyrinomonadaceae bacterium]|jgi:polysaccharide chain length determinant protein (PEP-CTERM system associated)